MGASSPALKTNLKGVEELVHTRAIENAACAQAAEATRTRSERRGQKNTTHDTCPKNFSSTRLRKTASPVARMRVATQGPSTGRKIARDPNSTGHTPQLVYEYKHLTCRTPLDRPCYGPWPYPPPCLAGACCVKPARCPLASPITQPTP